jgi:hypothetical protein
MIEQNEEDSKKKHEELIKTMELKHSEAQNELSTNHKKQIDELRNFYSISTINLKKVL